MSVNGNGANNSTACLILTAQKAGEAEGREGGGGGHLGGSGDNGGGGRPTKLPLLKHALFNSAKDQAAKDD